MAELEYALLAEFAKVDDAGGLTLVGAHRAAYEVVGVPNQHVVCLAGRLFMGRREPAAMLSLGALTPEGEVPLVAQWAVEPRPAALENGRLPVCFAATLVAPVPAAGAYALSLSVNGELVRHLPFVVSDSTAPAAPPGRRAAGAADGHDPFGGAGPHDLLR